MPNWKKLQRELADGRRCRTCGLGNHEHSPWCANITIPDAGEPLFRQEYPTAEEIVDHPRGGG